MTKFIAILLTILFPALSQAGETLVITDIDDTLKITHVRSFFDKVRSGFEVDRAFIGMSTLLSSIQENDPQAKIVYLSNAPKFLMERAHATFLERHQFPPGTMILRESDADTFKFKAIFKLISSINPDRVILIGDNGEADPMVFSQIRSLYPNLPILSFVHAIYYKNTSDIVFDETLIPYATAADLAIALRKFSYLSPSAESDIIGLIKSEITKDSEREGISSQVLPYWTNCHPSLQFNYIGDEVLQSHLRDACGRALR